MIKLLQFTDHYGGEYSQQYLIPAREAEYEVRSNVLVDGGDRYGVSAVVFDKYEELIWMGNQGVSENKLPIYLCYM